MWDLVWKALHFYSMMCNVYFVEYVSSFFRLSELHVCFWSQGIEVTMRSEEH